MHPHTEQTMGGERISKFLPKGERPEVREVKDDTLGGTAGLAPAVYCPPVCKMVSKMSDAGDVAVGWGIDPRTRLSWCASGL
jgi:hypothetical protein